jgi:peptidoglycan hydrolase FlgJ
MSDIAVTSMGMPQAALAPWAAPRPRLKGATGAKASPNAAPTGEALRKKVGEFVGNIFYGTLLRQMQNSKLKGKYFHGGRGEDVFQGQLGMELASRLGRASNNPVVNRLYGEMSRQNNALSEAIGKNWAA